MYDKKRVINLCLGPGLFILACYLLPDAVFDTDSSKQAIGVVMWMAYWWVTRPVDYAVTGFIPIVLNAVLNIADMSTVLANYASDTIILLLGASIIIVAWDETGLDRRIAARFLGMIGSNFRTHLLFWFFLSLVLSAFLPNAVVCATITPLAVSMLRFVGEEDISCSEKGSKLLLYIAYATGIGGLASPLGGAMNLVTVDYLQQITGEEYYYLSWVIRFAPIVIVLTIICVLFMLRDVEKEQILGKTRDYFINEYSCFPKISSQEKISLVIFLVAVILSFSRQLYQAVLPGLKPAYVFLACSVLTFLISTEDGERVMRWKNIQGKIEWEMLLIFAGGLGVGTLMTDSGAVADIGRAVSESGLTGGIALTFMILSITLLLSDVTSNTATAAVAMPIVISIANGLGVNPIPYVYIASIGVNLSFMLPTSIRAIPVGYGLSPRYMLREGWKLSLLVIAIIGIMSYLLLENWQLFSTI